MYTFTIVIKLKRKDNLLLEYYFYSKNVFVEYSLGFTGLKWLKLMKSVKGLCQILIPLVFVDEYVFFYCLLWPSEQAHAAWSVWNADIQNYRVNWHSMENGTDKKTRLGWSSNQRPPHDSADV